MIIQTPPPRAAGAQPNRRPRRTPKGRQVEPQALAEVRALLGEKRRRRGESPSNDFTSASACGSTWRPLSTVRGARLRARPEVSITVFTT
jgi:hypothetical protein